MSDFDKEAEREKLREKYEQDQEDRRATQQMSELLLKGATMTNQHCDTCGDPVFRYEGQAFCPSCQREAAGEANQQAQEAGTAGDADEATPQARSDASTATDATQANPTSGAERDAARRDVRDSPSQSGEDRDGSDRVRETVEATERQRVRTPDGAADRSPGAARSGRGSPLGDATASLEETLTYFAREAAATDDPRRARECLAAAREAAETLSALRR